MAKKSSKKTSEKTKIVPDKPAKKADRESEALKSFLERSQEPEKDAEKAEKETKTPAKGRLSRNSIALIAAIAVVAVLIIIIVIIVNRPAAPGSDDSMITYPAELATTVDEKGEHHVEVSTDEDGEIAQNGYGELVSYTPAEIQSIAVENTGGSFTVNASTPEGGATVYTVTGLEGYELRTGMADAVANDAARLSFTSIAAVNGSLADFGLDNPRSVVTVSYTDGTGAVIRVGNEADGGMGAYVTLGGTNDVFLVPDDSVDSFLYTILEMVSYDITPKAETVEDSLFSVIEITGTRYDDRITIVPNTDQAVRADYRLTSPYEMFADTYECNDIAGSIRDLYAESVVCVNPSDGQLSEFGVAEPYARVYAVYPDIEIDLSCSAPADDGLVNLYNPAKGIIYTIRRDALGWTSTDMDRLLPKTVIDLDRAYVSGIEITSTNKSYSMEVKTTSDKIENENGDTVEELTTDAALDGKKIAEDAFLVFFQNFNNMKNLGRVDDSGSKVIYEWKVSYSSDRDEDVIAIYDSGDKACPVLMNGVMIGSVSKSHVSALQQDILDLKSGKTPKSL